MKKHLKDGSLYFRQRDILRPIGAVLLPLGLVVLYFGWSYVSYILCSIAVPTGLVLFIVGGSRIISDNDFNEQIDHAMIGYDTPITDMAGYDRAVLKQPAPVEISAYSFGGDAAFFKKCKNGTPVSDRFTRSHVFFTKDSVLMICRSLSLTELNETTGEGISDREEQFYFSNLTSAELLSYETRITLTNTGKPMTVKWCELVLHGEEGELFRIPTKNDMDAANLVEDINRRCSR